jgi:hypothetical protein
MLILFFRPSPYFYHLMSNSSVAVLCCSFARFSTTLLCAFTDPLPKGYFLFIIISFLALFRILLIFILNLRILIVKFKDLGSFLNRLYIGFGKPFFVTIICVRARPSYFNFLFLFTIAAF